MSAGAVAGVAVVILAALIAAVSLGLSDRRKKKEENRRLAIVAYGQARIAWDQAQVGEVTLAVRSEKLGEARRRLVEVKLLVGTGVQTQEMETLIALLDTNLLAPINNVDYALAKTIWPQVEAQIYEKLAGGK
jgi:hypothetical protein